MTSERWRGVGGVLSVALVTRLAVVPLSVAQANPYAQADAIAFARAAQRAARFLGSGQLPPVDPADVIQVWGAFLSPFWVLPGPSLWYAHLATVLLGVGAVYNVYALTAGFASHRAGLLAAAVVAALPSIVVVQASILREGAVMFGLTTVLRLWLAPAPSLSRLERVCAVTPVLLFTFLLRTENGPLYALVGAAYVFLWTVEHSERLTSRAVTLLGLTAGGVLASVVLPRAAAFLARIRAKRARGDSVYLAETVPRTATDLLAFGWVAVAYFLFAPFPWMVAGLADLVVMWEGLLNLGFLAVGVYGIRRALHARKSTAAVLTLVVAFATGSLLYGLANANFGTAVRQRQMFLPILYLFGAIGITDRIDLRLPRDRAPAGERSRGGARERSRDGTRGH